MELLLSRGEQGGEAGLLIALAASTLLFSLPLFCLSTLFFVQVFFSALPGLAGPGPVDDGAANADGDTDRLLLKALRASDIGIML